MSQRSKNTETTTGTPAGGLIFGWICHPFLLETGATSCISFELKIYIYIGYIDFLLSLHLPIFTIVSSNLFHPTKNHRRKTGGFSYVFFTDQLISENGGFDDFQPTCCGLSQLLCTFENIVPGSKCGKTMGIYIYILKAATYKYIWHT